MLDRAVGLIDACEHACCGRRCCDFSSGNFIVLYPGELNTATAAGVSLVHLVVRPSDDGGHRAVCRAGDTATCDGGYKPLDCASYPFFPTLEDDGCGAVRAGLHSPKCPLAMAMLGRHAAWVATQWRTLADASGGVRRWLKRVKLVGYQKTRRGGDAPVEAAGAPPKPLAPGPAQTMGSLPITRLDAG